MISRIAAVLVLTTAAFGLMARSPRIDSQKEADKAVFDRNTRGGSFPPGREMR